MDLRLFLTVFGSVFLAEIGDKTQLATMLYASGAQNSRLVVFLASSLALVLASLIGVIAGAALSKVLQGRAIGIAAGIGFIAVGIWVIAKA
jgi:putative Ca2+/H+ antiporter (TMEM165/GDT1 family)